MPKTKNKIDYKAFTSDQLKEYFNSKEVSTVETKEFIYGLAKVDFDLNTLDRKDPSMNWLYFYCNLVRLDTYEKQFNFIEKNFDFLVAWWCVDCILQYMIKPMDFDFVYERAKGYVLNDNPYVRRLGYVIFLCKLISCENDENFNKENNDKILSLLKDDDEYTVQMGEAWLISEIVVKAPVSTTAYIKQSKLKYNILGKAIQKCCDSFRISNEIKEYLKSLRKEKK